LPFETRSSVALGYPYRSKHGRYLRLLPRQAGGAHQPPLVLISAASRLALVVLVMLVIRTYLFANLMN